MGFIPLFLKIEHPRNSGFIITNHLAELIGCLEVQALPAEVWINQPKTRATEETRGLAGTRGGVLDNARPGQLVSVHRSHLRWPGCWEAPV